MNKETQYRTLDELLDSVTIDLKGIDWENMVEPIELIKVAERINAELGVSVSPRIDRCLDLKNGVAKLPTGFHAMNNVWLLQDVLETKGIDRTMKTYAEELVDNLQTAQELINKVYSGVRRTQIQTITTTLNKGINTIKHKLKTNKVVVQAVTVEDEILIFDFDAPNDCDVIINNEANQIFENVTLTIVAGSAFSDVESLEAEISKNTIKVNTGSHEIVYGNPEQLELVKPLMHGSPTETFSVFGRRIAYLKNNCIHVPGVKDGILRISYTSKMENEEGEYIVLDHPLVNDYYEYSIKERLFENLVMAGHPEYAQRMQLAGQKAEMNKIQANGYVNTPDFAELKRNHRMQRARTYHKYYRNQR